MTDAKLRDLARTIQSRYGPVEAATLRQATVDTVDPAGPCSVSLDGVSVPAYWLGAAPSVGETVWAVRQGGVLLVLGALGPHGGFSGGRFFLTVDQLITSSTVTWLDWTGVVFDTDAYLRNPSLPERLFVPEDGHYRLDVGFRWFPSETSTNAAYVDIYTSNGGLVSRLRPWEGAAHMAGNWLTSSGAVYMNKDDYFRVRVYQDSAASVYVQGGTEWETWASVEKLG